MIRLQVTFNSPVEAVLGGVIIPEGLYTVGLKRRWCCEYTNMDKVFPRLTGSLHMADAVLCVEYWHGNIEMKIGTKEEIKKGWKFVFNFLDDPLDPDDTDDTYDTYDYMDGIDNIIGKIPKG